MFNREWQWPLRNSAEASLFARLLNEDEIPFRMIRHGDSLWAYATEMAEGWGHVEVDKEFESQLDELYQAFQSSEAPLPEDVDIENTN